MIQLSGYGDNLAVLGKFLTAMNCAKKSNRPLILSTAESLTNVYILDSDINH